MAQIFISYARKDHSFVARLREDLEQAGIDHWIDHQDLAPGTDSWELAIREALKACESVLWVVSPSSFESAYVRDEISIARMDKRKIYPVFVDGDNWLDCVPLGTGEIQYIDARENYDVARNLILETLGASDSIFIVPDEPIPILPTGEDPRNPYKGLQAFRAEDQANFFGRDALIEILFEAVEQKGQSARLLAILGASGSGKSSVIMAGLLPKLEAQHPDWIFLDPIVPGNHPIENLTIALARQFEKKAQAAIREDLLDRSTRGLHRLARELSDKPVVLYIDQFEEVFTLVDEESERRQFIDLLTTASTEANGILYVLLSMRADFYDRPLQYKLFGDLLAEHHTPITPMTLADLYDVIQKPVQNEGVSFEEGLVTELVFEVRNEIGALPLLQFTLEELFEQRKGNTLTISAYEQMGGLKRTLPQYAEHTFMLLSSNHHKRLARTLFLRLIEVGQTEQDTTRRRASYSELILPDINATRILQEVASTFADARLLVSDQSGDERTLEVSHEALIREWERLGEWLRDAREDLRLQKSLSADVADWKRRNQPDDMLYRGTVLKDAQAWSERNSASRDETHFLNASKAAEKERQEKEARTARRLRYLAFGLVGVIVIASIGLTLIFAQNNADLLAEAEDAKTQIAQLEVIIPGATQGARLEAIIPGATRGARLEYSLSQLDTEERLQIFQDSELWSSLEREIESVIVVLVPPGCFLMGSNSGYSNEHPVHEICFEEPFWIDKYEVTNGQYFSIGCTDYSRESNQPRNCVTWFNARDYCEQRGARLPTEAEWEYAARGPDSLIYPWGNDYIAEYVIGADDPTYGSILTAPVGSRPNGASWVGALDMSGNLFEWVSTVYEIEEFPYPYRAKDGRENLNRTDLDRVLRGGSIIDGVAELRSANRFGGTPQTMNGLDGFRCARSYP